MTDVPDLGPTALELVRVAGGVRDDQLGAPTPCLGWSTTDLLEHLLGLTVAFAAAARSVAPAGADEVLTPQWRELLRHRADDLVAAWRRPEAWQGQAEAGGVVMAGEQMGVVALDELLLHGWDLARAKGQGYDPDPVAVEVCTGLAAAMSVPGQEAGREGLYGPVVLVPEGAPSFDRLLGLAGRHPGWAPR